MEEKQIILFDGICNLCNSSINFIIDRDVKNVFVFAALQDKTGQELQIKHGIDPKAFESVILIKKGKVYKKSSAALEIVKELSGWWKILYIFKIVPTFLRNFLYDLIAKNRYRWFGRTTRCRLSTPELKTRFI